jgi:hypothetical protein
MHRAARCFLTRHTSAAIGAVGVAVIGLAGCSDAPIAPPSPAIQPQLHAAAPTPTACPAGLPVEATCYTGLGESGAAYLIAVPVHWEGTLLLFNRGGTPIPLTSATALGPARLLMREGFAFAASAYRGSTLAGETAEDTEELRRIFVHAFGKPRRTVVYGASFGGLVTARCMELYGVSEDGSRNYEGALTGCGILAGTLRSNYTRLDLRVVYQYYCRNHPRPSEPQYPLYLGLAPSTEMTVAQLQTRVNECTGILLPANLRSDEQRHNLANLLSVLRIPENDLLPHMSGATFNFRDLVQRTLGGRNPFPNVHVHYKGSTDDKALNHGVERYQSDPTAVADLRATDDPTGHVTVPIVTLHAIDDGRAFVEQEAAYRETLEEAGAADLLFQTYTNYGGHCVGFSTPEWLAALTALLQWIDTGVKPTQQHVVSTCERYQGELGGSCTINPTFKPAPLVTRIYPRHAADK